MFILTESFLSALGSIRAHALRSFLTMLGIIIGVASVIAMVSIIQGFEFFMQQQFAGLGSNSITIRAFNTREDILQGRRAKLTPDDLRVIEEKIAGIKSITPQLPGQGGAIRFGAQTASGQVIGTTYTMADAGQHFTKQGRFISISDNQTRRRVCVIGEEIRKNLSLPDDPVGEYINYGGEWVKVIGLLESRGALLGMSMDNIMFMPYTTVESMIGSRREPDIAIVMSVVEPENIKVTVEQIRRLLRREHDLKPNQRDDFVIQTSEELQDTISGVLTVFTAVMAGILGISLLVSGIGIMNIMLVSVTERTREIGICKAIGAKRHHILLQFLFESVFLCLFGGLIGLLLGYGIGSAASSIFSELPAAHIPLWAIALSFGFSASVGIIFGILPAAKAANLDPIEALRFE